MNAIIDFEITEDFILLINRWGLFHEKLFDKNKSLRGNYKFYHIFMPQKYNERLALNNEIENCFGIQLAFGFFNPCAYHTEGGAFIVRLRNIHAPKTIQVSEIGLSYIRQFEKFMNDFFGE